VVRSLLHGVVDFFGCQLLLRLIGVLLHFSFRLKEYGAIFCEMIDFIVMKHVVWRPNFVWASVMTTIVTWCATSLTILGESLIEGSRVSFLRRYCKVLLPILWWPTSIRINTMHWLRVAMLAVIVMRSWAFVWL
jgi:hypothetical protein